VQSYIRTGYFVGYVILLIVLFVLAILAMNNEENYTAAYRQWWHLDIPWILLTLTALVPTFQMARYRRTFLTAELDEMNRTCDLVGNGFTGQWSIKNKYPRRMVTAQAAAVIMSFVVLILFILDIKLLYHVWHTPVLRSSTFNKVNAVQGLCISLILASTLLRMWTFWKYPNLIMLRKPGKWLSAQFRDTI
jgi:uncharacterized integral membrane protein